MSNLQQFNFNAEDHEPDSAFELVPDGKYRLIIVGSEVKANSKGTGTILKLEIEICEGDHKGRKIWDQLNMSNPSPAAVEISMKKLSAIGRATGVMAPSDSSELHDKPFYGMISRRAGGDGVIRNEIKRYIPDPTGEEKSAPATPAKSTSTGVSAPWNG